MFLQPHLTQISHFCQQNNVKHLFAFGSVLTDKFNDDSDIDLIVEIADTDPIIYSDHYFALKFQLEDLLNRPIDLLEQKMIKNPYFLKEINQTKIKIYG